MTDGRMYQSNAEKQQAYRDRKYISNQQAELAQVRLRKIEKAVKVAAENGRLPKEKFTGMEFGNWVNNLVDYLVAQEQLPTGKNNKAPRKK